MPTKLQQVTGVKFSSNGGSVPGETDKMKKTKVGSKKQIARLLPLASVTQRAVKQEHL
jgi:hypothetical protein